MLQDLLPPGRASHCRDCALIHEPMHYPCRALFLAFQVVHAMLEGQVALLQGWDSQLQTFCLLVEQEQLLHHCRVCILALQTFHPIMENMLHLDRVHNTLVWVIQSVHLLL